ncbi:Phosphoribosylglycinamide formyltransferase [Candidatus Sodalis pierantonius str. SOPE]|uniref:Phosphoribosylglycinamide formyltransferase n=1 Tax=Candidatus Sodalis pierantonii str. SOPE TaxID=2342 RepID=W0HKW3_9GAMM|nr:phosphoribosylglycinamide formyltransferase [Candidatus Sodalis pierantonius]AHF74511.1 Phosphoribosylglycinamide formyltransferase [Candidatus Sodalis pierantonius str. SOPE]
MKRLVVLISGEGSNLQALIEACQQGKIAARIAAVISHRADAYGLTRVAAADIEAKSLNPADFAGREAFDLALSALIDRYRPEAIVLAGYMRILSTAFVARYAGRMLNVHPSLLPRYPGLHTHRQALANGDAEHGTSVHFVTDELDGGPVVLQARVPVFAGDDEQILAQRVKAQEHAIYPLVVGWLLAGRLTLRDNVAWLDGAPLPAAGYAAD